MKFSIFQHVPYETPGYILQWIHQNHGRIEEFNWCEQPRVPDLKNTENLIVMGGPMNIYNDAQYPWLRQERAFIKKALLNGNRVLGVCLGAQFIADALGARVYPNKHAEVGWFDVEVNQQNVPGKYKGIFPERFKTFHWHGDTFDLPRGLDGFISSKATLNQAFITQNAAAIQFHPEMNPEGVKALLAHHEKLFEQAQPFVQKPGEMLGATENHLLNQKILFQFLDLFFEI